MTFVDCPGSTEFLHEMRNVTPVCDAAVVVCEADERKIPALEIILRELEEADIPRFLFINKIDTANQRIRETLALLQQASRTPLLLRQIPLWKDGIAVGFIDLALERAFIYREHAPSEIVDLPEGELPREKEARFAMLERLADHDDELMEELISEIEPPRDQIFDDLSKELKERHVVPALIGSAERGNGVTRLLKALRHEAPTLTETRARLGIPEEGPPLAQGMKTLHMGQGGKLSVARVMRGTFHEGDTVVGSRSAEARIGSLLTLMGSATTRKAEAGAGDTVGFGRLEGIATGDSFAAGKARPDAIVSPAPPEPVYVLALKVKDRKDDVRLSSALAKITEEDPSLAVETRPEMGEIRLHGQGEMHLRVAVEKLASRFQVGVETARPKVAYCETIKLPVIGPRAAPQADRRPRPVRRRDDRDQAAAARGGLRLPGQDHRRRGAPPVHPLRRDRRAGCAQMRAARLSGGRSGRDADGRLLPHGRFLGCGLPGGGQARPGGGPAEGEAGPAGARAVGRDHDPVRRAVQGDRPRRPDGAGRSSAMTSGPAGTDGRCSAPPFRNRRSAISSSSCARPRPASGRSRPASTIWRNSAAARPRWCCRRRIEKTGSERSDMIVQT